MNTDDPNEWESKLALDHAELVECVPKLQADVADINVNDKGVPVLVIPSHPRTRAFIKDLEGRELRELEIIFTTSDGRDITTTKDPDLKTARRKLRAATESYQSRVAYRFALAGSPVKINQRAARLMSLSAILIARSEAKFWRKIVTKLEHIERTKKHNRWAAAYAGLIRL